MGANKIGRIHWTKFEKFLLEVGDEYLKIINKLN